MVHVSGIELYLSGSARENSADFYMQFAANVDET
jgi:hypothetical protein